MAADRRRQRVGLGPMISKGWIAIEVRLGTGDRCNCGGLVVDKADREESLLEQCRGCSLMFAEWIERLAVNRVN